MPDPRISSHEIIAAFEAAVSTYDKASVVHQEVGSRLQERLRCLTLVPHTILDLGCNIGRDTKILAKTYRQAQITALDITHTMVKAARRRNRFAWRQADINYCIGRAEQLPLVESSFDMIYSNLVLQWCPYLPLALSECARVLREQGVLFFATVGPDTFKELRTSVRHVFPQAEFPSFVDIHEVGDTLVQVGFADPVLEVDELILTYGSFARMLQELRDVGALRLALGNMDFSALSEKSALVEQYFMEHFSQDKLLPLRYEIVYGHAWCRKPSKEIPEVKVAMPKSRRNL